MNLIDSYKKFKMVIPFLILSSLIFFYRASGEIGINHIINIFVIGFFVSYKHLYVINLTTVLISYFEAFENSENNPSRFYYFSSIH